MEAPEQNNTASLIKVQADESDDDDDGEEPLIGPGSFAKQFIGALTTKRKAMMIVCAALCVIAVFGLLIDLNPIDGDLVCRCKPGWEGTACDKPVDMKETCSASDAAKHGCGNGVCYQEDDVKLTWKSYVTVGVVTMALVAMIEDAPPDMVMIAATVALLVFGIISAEDAWSGFSQPGVLSVGVLFAVAAGIQESGVVDLCMRSILGNPSTVFAAQMRLLLPVAMISAFMNNTPVVAMLIPVVESWSQRCGFKPAVFLMPLSFASMLGGTITLLGTSTNLVVQALLDTDQYKHQTLGMFELAPVGGVLTVIGSLYMAVVSPHMLGGDAESAAEGDQEVVAAYGMVFTVEENSPIIGETLGSSGLLSIDGVVLQKLVEQESGNEIVDPSQLPDATIHAQDRLHFQCTAESVPQLRRLRGLALNNEDIGKLGRRRRHRRLVEAVLGRSSQLCGQRADSCEAFRRYGAAVLAVRKAGDPLVYASSLVPTPRSRKNSTTPRSRHNSTTPSGGVRGRGLSTLSESGTLAMPAGLSGVVTLSGVVSPHDEILRPGDIMLLEVSRGFKAQYNNSQNHFLLIREVEDSKPPRFDEAMDQLRMGICVLALCAMVGLSASGVLDLLPASIIAVLIIVLSKVMSLDEIFAAIKGRVILAIVATFGVSAAMEKTGVARFIAQGLVHVCKQADSDYALLAAIFLVAAAFGCVVSNNATCLLMLPICSAASESSGIPFKRLVVTLLMAASSSFLTPISYQTNLMVFGPGGYSFGDYFKFGGPLVLILMVVTVLWVPVVIH